VLKKAGIALAGTHVRTAKQAAMARFASTIDEQDLERALLRKTVDALAVQTHRCVDCGRAPLIGETLHRYPGAVAVCELCRPLRREAPEGSERVRNSEFGHAVRIHRLEPT
jgi:hypothetical protein